MTTTRTRGATRLVPVLLALLVIVLAARQLETAPQALAPPVHDAYGLSASDRGVLTVASRTPIPVQEARLDFGAATPLGTAALFTLVWSAALAVGRGRLVLDMLGVRCRRRGPPSLFAI